MIAGFTVPLTTTPQPVQGARMTEKTVAEKSFLGVPIVGDINETNPRTAQKPIEDLAPLFQAVLDDRLIVEFGWQQYTPYFNDGDPCEFSVYSPWFRTTQDADVDTYSLEVDCNRHPTLGEFEVDYVGTFPDRVMVEKEYIGEHEATLRTCQALNAAIGSGAFDDVLQASFGDHAQVVVRRDGIEVETYEHD